MDDYFRCATQAGFTMKLWRGERMCLVGFDVAAPEPDFVGFAIECREPGASDFHALGNRIAFAYDTATEAAVTGARKFDSRLAPFQKFRWVHFPFDPKPGTYTYRATKMHMSADARPVAGTVIELPISLDPVTYADFLDIGFTRGFASSQAFVDKFPPGTDLDAIGKTLLPSSADAGLAFAKPATGVYDWMGFEAHDLLMRFLDDAIADAAISVDFLAYDLNEPDVVAKLERLGPRLRAIIDDSTTTDARGGVKGHGAPASAESQAAERLRQSAGASRVKRTHFSGLQHNKVLIALRDGVPVKVLAGSMNFSFRGIYIQSNNVLVFDEPAIADLYERAFAAAFSDPSKFSSGELASAWHVVERAGRPTVKLCFSPHKSTDLSLEPVRRAIDEATSSVFYCVAFLNQIKSGPTEQAFARLMTRPIFSYGISDKRGALEFKKPGGGIGLVDFTFLSANAPEPFRSEWSGQQGINLHHKFVVTDFSLPSARVFTGSSNLSPGGEGGNGDNLILFEDSRIATSYAIEAVRVFDHLHFRDRMRGALAKTRAPGGEREALTLQKPSAISGKPAWFERYYVDGSPASADRKLFST